MKKYLYQFMVALMAITSFAFASCSDDDDPIGDSSYNYVSGRAIVANTNPSESKITIAFDNLNMSKDNNTYSFNGTVTLPFSYDGW